MFIEDYLSSDDSNEPILRNVASKNFKSSLIINEAQWISDSESDENEEDSHKNFKTEIKTETCESVNLISSDEDSDSVPAPSLPEKVSKTVAGNKRKIKTIELLTSDEDDTDVPTSSSPKKKCNTLYSSKSRKTSKLSKGNVGSSEVDPALSPSNSLPTTIENDKIVPTWKDYELLSDQTQLNEDVVKNLIRLWEEGNTIPFIARYRKNLIGNLPPEVLQTTKQNYDNICSLKRRMSSIAKTITQQGKIDNKLLRQVCAARSNEELEYLYAPFKPESRRSLAERAKHYGLQQPALHLLNNTGTVNFEDYVNKKVKDLETSSKVQQGIVHILASEIATDTELLVFLRKLRVTIKFRLQSKKISSKTESSNTTLSKRNFKVNLETEQKKFEMYFDFNQSVDYVKSHQILAINRGESLKILKVKIEIPEQFSQQYQRFCKEKWANTAACDVQRQIIIYLAIDDAYTRLITPLTIREIRAELKQKAEKESCQVFSNNLKHLLLSQPLKGKAILGIDPGFKNGCKLALISPTGSLIAHNVIYPHTNGYNTQNRGECVIKDLLTQHKCNLIAIGNGTACRQTEVWISSLIQSKYFGNLDVQYTIVNEDGASIYSCSAEAKREFNNLDPNIISAVSLARRIQDPMAELVKVEPSHLGIGMYQLDLKKKHLEEALSEVVSECVSFVGVDLNTASQCLLRRVAGLSSNRATQIIDHRERNGPFKHRKELLQVFGIGERIFEQCAGFLRVTPINPFDKNFYNQKDTTLLDATVIHPESYPIVRSLLGEMNLKEKEIGSEQFINCFKALSIKYDTETLAKINKTDKETMDLIFDALKKPLSHDLRVDISRTPLFKSDVTSINDLQIGTIITGKVRNVTSFGAFIDLGVGINGLVHEKFMRGLTLHLGDVLEVRVQKIDLVKKHIHLQAIQKV
ncbi:hypothetical protein ABEB36_011712 [Hypothenemus hampei]|uniref:S1 motif domain-containing protein n=1 Tax=Hypothenemus hampei TaxID=57062 RepID=A0ABD1EBG6_HYPHA